MTKILLGTRGSKLALAQANTVKQLLIAANPSFVGRIEIKVIRTLGDELQSSTEAVQADKAGLFVDEIEKALLEKRIDGAVHSLKDLPAKETGPLKLIAFLPRQSVHDVMLFRKSGVGQEVIDGLGETLQRESLVVGTSSPRRAAMVLHFFKSFLVKPIRGNVDTRMSKLVNGDYDAIILARAGLNRLELHPTEAFDLPKSHFVPAGGQATVVLQTRSDHAEIAAFRKINDGLTEQQAICERRFLENIGASCLSAVGVNATCKGDQLSVSVAVYSLDGRRCLKALETGDIDKPSVLADRLSERMFKDGVKEILVS